MESYHYSIITLGRKQDERNAASASWRKPFHTIALEERNRYHHSYESDEGYEYPGLPQVVIESPRTAIAHGVFYSSLFVCI